jgi:hypothetical protein
MKFPTIVLLQFIFINSIISCNTTSDKPAIHDTVYIEKKPDTVSTASNIAIPKDATEGDFDGDGKKEFVWLVSPKINADGTDCEGDCDCYLKFSNPSIPNVTVQQCIGGAPVNHGDLNNDGSDEIGLLRDWFSSCWSGYLVYTLEGGKWINAVETFSTHCNQWEAGVIPIEKDKANPGHAIIRYSESTDDSIVLREKSVLVQ